MIQLNLEQQKSVVEIARFVRDRLAVKVPQIQLHFEAERAQARRELDETGFYFGSTLAFVFEPGTAIEDYINRFVILFDMIARRYNEMERSDLTMS